METGTDIENLLSGQQANSIEDRGDYREKMSEGAKKSLLFDLPPNTLYEPEAVIPSDEEYKMPDAVANNVSQRFAEALDDPNFGYIEQLPEVVELNEYLDDKDAVEHRNIANDALIKMAEDGVPAHESLSWFRAYLDKHPQAYGSGVYKKMAENRLLSAAQDAVTRSIITSPEDYQLAGLVEGLQTTISNYQMVYDKAVEASAKYDSQGMITKMGKGFFTGALVPGVDNLNARRVSDNLKKVFGDKFETTWSLNKLFEETRNKLMSAAATMTPEEMKQFINDIDSVILGTTAYTLGDRENFWNQVLNTNYTLNRAVPLLDVGSTALGIGGALKASTAISKVAGKKVATKAFAIGALNEFVPGTGILMMTMGKALTSPLKMMKLAGQSKQVSKVLSKDAISFLVGAAEDASVRSQYLLNAGKEIVENGLSGVASTVIKDVPSSAVLKNSDAVIGEAIVDSAIKSGVDSVTADEAVNIAKDLAEGSTVRRLRESAKNRAEENFITNFLSSVSEPQNRVVSVSSSTTGNKFATTLKIGSGSTAGKAFASKKEAEEFMKSMKIVDNSFMDYEAKDASRIVHDANGYWVETTRSYLENGNPVNISAMVKKRMIEYFPEGARFKYSGNRLLSLLSTNNTVPHYVRTLNNLVQADEGRAMRTLNQLMNTVKQGDGPMLDTLMDITKTNGKWLTEDSMKQIGVPQKTIDAYRAVKVTEDVTYLLNGKTILEGMQETGMKNISVNGVRIGIGREVSNPSEHAFYDVTTTKETIKTINQKEPTFTQKMLSETSIRKDYIIGSVPTKEDRKLATRSLIKYLKSEDYKRLSALDSVNVFDSIDETTNKVISKKVGKKEIKSDDFVFVRMQRAVNGSNYLAIRKSALEMKEPSWSDVLMSYKPGRTNFVSDTGFIKQVATGTNEDGEKFIKGINTIFAHPNRTAVKEVANTLEQMRQVAIKYNDAKGAMSLGQAQTEFNKIAGREHTRYTDFDSFYKDCVGDDAVISLDKDAVLQYAADGQAIKVPAGFSEKDYNFRGASMMEYTNSEKALNKLKRKDVEVFDPFNMDLAIRVNVEQEMSQQVAKIMKHYSVGAYTDLFAGDFKNTFRDFLPDNMDAKEALLHFNPNNVADKTVRNEMINAQTTYRRMMSQPTAFDEVLEDMSKNVANWIAPGWKTTKGSNRLKLFETFDTLSPSRKLRSIAFQFNLGMWNPRQLYVQSLASVNAALMSPKAAAKITPIYMALSAYADSGDKSLLTRIAKGFGLKQEYINDLVESAKKLDIYSKGSFGGAYTLAERKNLWDNATSTYFFDKGEHVNRMYTAFITAQEALDQGIKIKDLPDEALAQWINRQQNLYINMGRAGSSEVQRGVAGVLTQFRGYQMRALEMMFDKTLTTGEKMRYLLGNAILGGTKGFVGSKWGSMLYNTMSDHDFNDKVAETIYNGALDELIREMGGRYSAGEFFSTGFGDLLDMSSIVFGGEVSAPSYMVLNKSVGAVTGLVDGLMTFGQGNTTRSAFRNTMDIMMDLANQRKLPTGWNNALLGWWALQTGKNLSSKGVLLDEDLDAFDAFMTGLGFKMIDRDIEQLSYAALDSWNKDIKDMADEGKRFFSLMYNSPEDMQDKYAYVYHNFLSTLSEEDPMKANAILKSIKSSKSIDSTLSTQNIRIGTSMLKATGHERFVKRLDDELKRAKERKGE